MNLVLTNGRELVGTRLGRTLFCAERSGVYDCEICGFPYIDHDPGFAHKAAVIASEPITHETWHPLPDPFVYTVGPDVRLVVRPL